MADILALKARRAANLTAMEAIIAAVPEGEDMTAEQVAEFDKLKAEDDRVTAEIGRLEDMERRKAAAAKPTEPLPGLQQTTPAQPKAEQDKGIQFARMFRALAAANGSAFVAQQIAESWGDSGLFANQNMGSGAAGGFLVPEDVSSEIIELLRPVSVVLASGARPVPMPNGNLTTNRQATGSQAQYIGEQQDVPATGATFGQMKLSAKKLAALIPISNDLLRANSYAVDRIVRDDVVTALALRGDLAFIRGAGTEYSPRGLRYQHVGSPTEATHVLSANATVNLANVTNDLAKLELALLNADVPMLKPGWLMSPTTLVFLQNIRDGNGNFAFPETQNGMLRGKPIKTTTQIPSNLGGGGDESEIYLVDFVHIYVGEHMGIDIAVSTEAAYRDANNQLQAAFNRDETVMRAIQQHDIGTRHLQAIAILTGVKWRP